MANATIAELVQTFYRDAYGKMVTALVSYFGLPNIATAEDIVQDTFIAALEHWGKTGAPDNPQAWLFRVCRNKTLNVLKQKQTLPYGALDFPDDATADYRLEQLFLDYEIKDNQLRLLFACCPPELSPKAQVIFILKNLCGLRVEEISRAMVMTPDAVEKTLTRSRQTLRDIHASLRIPFLTRSHTRLNSVHLAVYLLFNEGYSATEGDVVIRRDLCMEAMRLMRSVIDIPEICTADSYALMALMCFHASAFSMRLGTSGSLIALEQQDRSLRDDALALLGTQYFKQTQSILKPTRFVLEAAIASVHCAARTFEAIRWDTIIRLYEQLRAIQDSPVVDLSLAVALFYGQGAEAAKHALDDSAHVDKLNGSVHYYVLLGKIEQARGQVAAAREYYTKALSLTKLRAEQDFLTKKIAAL